MELAVLGATGRSGQQIVQQALDRGHSVRAVVRTPEKLKITHQNLEVSTCVLLDLIIACLVVSHLCNYYCSQKILVTFCARRWHAAL